MNTNEQMAALVYESFAELNGESKRLFLSKMFSKCYKGRRVKDGADMTSDLSEKLRGIHYYVFGIQNNPYLTSESKTLQSLINGVSDKQRAAKLRWGINRCLDQYKHIAARTKEHVFLLEMIDVLLDITYE
jgi:hypothetical protein